MNTRKSTIACLTALGVCAAAAMMVEVAVAQATRSEFLPTDKTCSQVVWRDDILERYAKINIACKEIVARNGDEYVKFSGKVLHNSKDGLRMKFEPTGTMFDVYPADRELAVQRGKDTRTAIKDLKIDDEIRIYVPVGRLVKDYLKQ